MIALVGPVLGYRWELSIEALFRDGTIAHTVGEGLIVAFFALAACWKRGSRTFQATAVGFGLMSSSAILVHLSGGYIELHFHFFVMLVFLALYQDWAPYLLAIVYVAIHHGLVGVLWPEEVYNHTAALNAPWTWALIHAFFVLWSCVGSVIAWRFNERAFAQTKLILDSAGEGIYGLDLQGRTTFINPAAARMLGYEVEELIGRSMHDVLHHSRADGTPYPREECPIYAAFKDGTVHRVTEEVFWRKDGTSFPVDYVSTPIFERGGLSGAVVTFRDVTHRRQAAKEAQRRAREQEALIAIARATSQSLRLDEILQIALDKVREVTGRQRVTIRLKDPVTGEARLRAHLGFSPEEIEELRRRTPHKMSDQVFASGEPFVIHDTKEVPPGILLERSRSVAWIPIKTGAKVVAIFGISDDESVPFSKGEIDLLLAIGNVVGVALENARLYEETERRGREAEELARVAQSLTETLDMTAVGERIVMSVRELFGVRASMLRLLQPDGSLRALASSGEGFSQDSWGDLLPAGMGVVGLAVAGGRPIWSADVLNEPRIRVTDQMRDYQLRSGNRSMIAVPLRAQERIIGSLGLADQTGRVYPGSEVALLQTFADQAALALENARLYEETQRRNRELQSLYTVTSTITRSLHIEPLMQAALKTTIDVLGVDAGRLYVLDEKNQVLRLTAYHGLTVDQVSGIESYAVGEGIIGKTFMENRPMVFADMASDANYAALARGGMGRSWGFRSAAGLPITIKERPVGVIYVYGRTVREFSSQDIDLLSAIGGQIGFAIENARLFQETQRNLEHMRALQEIDEAITSTLDLHQVLDVLLEKIDLLLPYSAATVRLLKRGTGEIEPVACRNLDEAEWKAEQWRGGRGIPNVVFETKAPLRIGNVQADPRVKDLEFFRRHGLVSYLGVPLIVKEEVLGVLSFYTKKEHQFSDEEVEFLTTLAGQAAIAIHNSQLYEETKRQAVELERANKVKDEFLSVMSHELRTPLNVVMGYTGMIKDRMLGEINPEQERALGKVVSRSKELLTMISGILEVTRIEAEEVRVERDRVKLGDFLRELESTYALPLDKEVRVHWDYPRDLPVVETDKEKLKLVLQNLISNAIKFTEKGTVTISARVREDGRTSASSVEPQQAPDSLIPGSRLLPRPSSRFVEFRVADTGIGIAKEFFPIIFEKFHQVDSSETRPYGG